MELSKSYDTAKELAGKVIDFMYKDLYFTIGFSTVVGAGNAIATIKDEGNFSHAFGEGFVNNFELGILINAIYPTVFNLTKKSKNFKTYAHIANLSLNTAFLAWHWYSGTENPIAACLPCYAIGTLMTEKQVREIKKDTSLEEKISSSQ